MDGNGRQTVLLVDDCPANRRLCEKLLEHEGFATTHATNGAEAVDLAGSILPHVIIMDVMMPVMDGLEATRALREGLLTSRIPIIILSAKAEEQDITAGLTAGADEYIVKPIRTREFRLRVRSMARLRQTQLDLERANATLYQRTQLLSRLNLFSEHVLENTNVEAICREIVEAAAEFMRSERVSLLVFEPSSQCLRFGYAIGIDEGLWRELTVPLDSPVAGEVFTTRKEKVLGDGDFCPGTAGTYASLGFASVPLICEPLPGKEGPVGVLSVTEKRCGGDYEHEDVCTLRQFAQTAALALNNVLTRQKLDQTRDSIIFSMAKLSEYRHQETGRHLERVQELSALLARHLAADPRILEKIDDQFIIDLRRAAPLHDIGKVAISDSILLKPGKLTDEEFRTMQDHTRIGAETLRSVITGGHEAGFLQTAVDIARHHHERFEGTGYPDALAGDDIPLSARIVCLADTYDAIRMKREYKPARTHEEASSEILKASGTQFDPRIVQAYCALDDAFRDTYERLHEEADLRSDAPAPLTPVS